MDTGSSSGRSDTWAWSRAAWARSASSPRPDTTQGSRGRVRGATVRPAAGASAVSWPPVASSAGACSMIRWALVPLMPNEETAARRGRPVSGQGRPSVSSDTAPADQSMCGDGSSMCRDFGT